MLSRNFTDDLSLLYSCCSQDLEPCQTSILHTEEVLLEALCFDFVVDSPHADLVDLFNLHESDTNLQELAWSFAHDS